MPTTSLTRTKWVSALHCTHWYLCPRCHLSPHVYTQSPPPPPPHTCYCHSAPRHGPRISYTQLHCVAACFRQVQQDGLLRRKKKKCPPPHIIFLLITHFLLRSPPHILNTSLKEKQAVTPTRVLTNLALPSPLHSLPASSSRLQPRSATLSVPAGLNLSQKNQWCAGELMPEDRRSQTNSHQGLLGHFLKPAHIISLT